MITSYIHEVIFIVSYKPISYLHQIVFHICREVIYTYLLWNENGTLN